MKNIIAKSIFFFFLFTLTFYSQNKILTQTGKNKIDKNGVEITLKKESTLRLEPTVKSSSKIIPIGSNITLLSFSYPFWKVLYLRETGYISDYFLESAVSNKIKDAFVNKVPLARIIIMDEEEKEVQVAAEDLEKANKAAAAEEEEKVKINIEKLKKIGSPIYFISAYVTFNAIENPGAMIAIENISKDTIDAYTVGIYCYNRFGEPVNHYLYHTNRFGGISQETIKPNEEKFGESWTLFGHENTSKIKVILEKVHFTNGKTWYSKKGEPVYIKGVSSL